MLNTEDDLSIYSAAWCIAWSGYDGADIIPYEIVADIADRLVELWSADTPPNLRDSISRGLYSVCMPKLKLQKRTGLKEIIEDRLAHPRTRYDRVAAVHMAIVS